MLALDLIRRSGRSLLTAKMRTLLTSFAIAVGAFALTLTLAASNGAQQYADRIVRDNFDPTELIATNDESIFNRTDESKPQVYDPSFGSVISQAGTSVQIKMLTDTDIARISEVKGVESVRPSISLSLQYLTRDGQKKYVSTIQAFDPYRTPDLLAGSIPSSLADHTVILPEGFVSALGFSSAQDAIGKTVRLAVQKQVDQTSLINAVLSGATAARATQPETKETNFTVIAVTKKPSTLVQPGTALYLYANNKSVIELNDYATTGTKDYHKYLTAFVKVKDGKDTSKLNATQAAIKKLGYGAQSVVDTQKVITQVIGVLQGIVLVFGLIAVVASVFGVVNTMYISVLQRTREIGLMKALGMHKGDISRLFLFEAALIGFIGGALGSLVAVLLGTLLNPTISNKLSLGDVHLLLFSLKDVAMLIGVLVLVAVAAGVFPARKAARLDPIDALRTE